MQNNGPAYPKFEKKEPSHGPFKGSQKITAFALSIIACLFMCVLGYEIIRANGDITLPSVYSLVPERNVVERTTPLFVLENSPPSPSFFAYQLSEEEEEEEEYPLKILKEQNKRLGAKVKALRQELANKTQGVHEIRAQLFKQEGDFRDKLKITELNEALSREQEKGHGLRRQVQEAENEAAAWEKKLTQLEITRETLIAMMEDQHAAKEQEIAVLKKEMRKLHNTPAAEIVASKKKVKLLERAQKHLTGSLEQKESDIGQLVQQLTSYKDRVAAKDSHFRNFFYSQLDTSESMRENILTLFAAIEWEATAQEMLSQDLAYTQKQLENAELLVLERENKLKEAITSHQEAQNSAFLHIVHLMDALEKESNQRESSAANYEVALQEYKKALREMEEQRTVQGEQEGKNLFKSLSREFSDLHERVYDFDRVMVEFPQEENQELWLHDQKEGQKSENGDCPPEN